MRNLQFERAQQAGVGSMRAPAMRGEEQKPSTHFVDRESKLAVPLKKGKDNSLLQHIFRTKTLIIFEHPWRFLNYNRGSILNWS